MRCMKELCKNARAGEIKNYTGSDSPYEELDNPVAVVYTNNLILKGGLCEALALLGNCSSLTVSNYD